MSDLCFICLSNTRIGACTQCKLKCHRKCWKEYTDSIGKHVTSRVRCPQCKIIIKRTYIITRSVKKHMIFNKRIKSLLVDCDKAKEMPSKKQVIRKIFSYLLDNMNYVNNNTSFKNTIKQKLVEFYTLNDWKYANDVHIQMFGTPVFDIPVFVII